MNISIATMNIEKLKLFHFTFTMMAAISSIIYITIYERYANNIYFIPSNNFYFIPPYRIFYFIGMLNIISAITCLIIRCYEVYKDKPIVVYSICQNKKNK